ncbi:DUF5324 family protein [Streptomyces bambusae]|uniref:DUF5324 family protein n=1 Tax=Streptomyces bambusae TaxID=1550616 RepID=UPI001CFEC478|nr:DUF5324 family protein [Streptomyces bambusae]MCB5163344.1 DUF5324 family protein [Streptomyces bambusae]
MTRTEGLLAAAGTAKESVRQAAEAVAPYAGTARDAALHYAHEANERLAPKMSVAAHEAARQARVQYGAHVAPRLVQARGALPPQVDETAVRMVRGTRRACRHAADYAQPRLEHAVAVGRPVAEEAASRSSAALAALRGQVSAEEVRRLVRKHERQARNHRLLKGVALTGLLAAGAFAAWKWWDQQSNPDWLVEPPAATEVADRGPLSAVDGSGQDRSLDDAAAEADAEAARRKDDGA